MNYVIRAAKPGDLQSIYEMAKLTGGGFTNLPPDRQALRAKLEGIGMDAVAVLETEGPQPVVFAEKRATAAGVDADAAPTVLVRAWRAPSLLPPPLCSYSLLALLLLTFPSACVLRPRPHAP